MRMTGKNHSIKTARIKDVAELDPETLGESTAPGFTFKYIDLSSVKGGRVGEHVESMTFAAAPGRARKLVKEGDILLGMVRPYLKPFAKVQRAFDGHVASTGFAVIRAKSDVTDPEYLYQTIWSDVVSKQIHQMVTGSNYPALSVGDVKDLKVPLPSLAEQRKIAEILRTWDEAIETAEAELNAKQERKRWLMEALIDEGGVNCDTEKLRTKSLLKEITSMASGGTPKTSVPEYYGGSIPWVSISDMTSGGSYIYGSKTQITEEGLSNSSARIFKKGTVLFAMYASIGECRIAGLDLTTSQAILGITPGHSIRSEYLYYFLCRIKETAKSYGQTGTQANLNKGIVGDFEISLPTLEEQDRILDILKTCDEDVEKASMLISALCVQKRGLMQKLLTGEVRVAA